MAARAPRDTDRPVRRAARGIAVNGREGFVPGEPFLVTEGGAIAYADRFFVKPLQRLVMTGIRGVCQ
jgi:hypothetical protein